MAILPAPVGPCSIKITSPATSCPRSAPSAGHFHAGRPFARMKSGYARVALDEH